MKEGEVERCNHVLVRSELNKSLPIDSKGCGVRTGSVL